ncbi:MAG TPA: sigma 54-interacting transcriptional regulator [Polyangia bacterium]|jgi:DNA-binding NtrC family response regulator|nr:sigma 54-interacting transcriptional regulator [Polyangia bacterium]
MNDLGTGTWIAPAVDGGLGNLRIRRCRLTVVAGPDTGLAGEFEANVIRVGARRGADLVLTDGKVSRTHFEIRLDARGYRLRDLESTNGTYVGGLRVNDVYVQPGASIYVGDSRLRFDPLDDSVEVALSRADRFGGLVGRSLVMRELFARLAAVAPTDATVLVTGETGTGKELVAEAIHEHSARKGGPFVVLDCGAIPPNLMESETFGHERGAFTGATAVHAGAFERANGGTLFLDEIGELPLEMQPKLLRALERREIRRVGGARVMQVNIRVVAATNRDLAVEVNKGRFREDLYYRLAVAHLAVPPLRERREDIPLLVEHILASLPEGRERGPRPETIELMKRHEWPGNVRELRNVLERAVLFKQAAREPSMILPVASAPPAAPSAGKHSSAGLHVAVDPAVPFKVAKQELIDEFERRYVRALLDAHGGNISAAARAAGIDRMSIHKILNRLGMDREEKTGDS